jgi:hypothetical protein
VALGFALSLAASDGLAQTSSGSDVPDHFRLELGGFRIGANTVLRLDDGAGTGSDVDFEDTLAVPETATRFYVEGYWRVGRRHQLSLGWFGNSRQGPSQTLSRDVVWGDHVFSAGADVQGEASTDYFSGVYRFAAYRSDRFEIGPSVGIGYLSVDAAIRGTATGPSGAGSFERSVSTGHVTGDVGGYLSWWAARRFQLRGDARYILVKPERAEASVTEARAAALYHPWRKVGVGLQYTYTNFRYERDILSDALGGSLRYKGGQILVDFAF